MNNAEANRKNFDEFVECHIKKGKYEIEFDDFVGLWTRRITAQNERHLTLIMEKLTCSFPFEAKEIVVENGRGFEIYLPKQIIDFGD